MKLYILGLLLACCCIGVVSCTGQDRPAHALDESSDCLVDSMALTVMGNTREAKFGWENGLPATCWMRWPSGKLREIAYTHNEKGLLESMIDNAGGPSFKYEYEDGTLMAIQATNDDSRIEFEYNDANQIYRQLFISNGETTRILKFGYDERGLPVQSQNIEPATDLAVSQFNFTYADQPNPLGPFGITINVFETSYGYPVGRCGHQVTSASITFLRDSDGPVNRQQKNAGDEDVISWTCEYNEFGWPQYWKMARLDMVNEAKFFYSCP